jgi:NADPH:quinone reductase-like Zn-dependent oxidoreductase
MGNEAAPPLCVRYREDPMSKMIRFHNFGKDVLKAEDLEISQPDVRALLVSVHAASVNPVDFKIRCKAWSMAGKEKRSSISSNSRQESA